MLTAIESANIFTVMYMYTIISLELRPALPHADCINNIQYTCIIIPSQNYDFFAQPHTSALEYSSHLQHLSSVSETKQ